jgi:hypothetical protein
MTLTHMELAGQPYDLGYHHGQICPDLVHRAYEFYSTGLPLEGEALAAALSRLEAGLLDWAPEAVEELHGIADGAKLPYPHVLTLNLFADLYNCTVIGLPQTSDGPLIGKTDDGNPEEVELEIFQRIRPTYGYSLMQYTMAGTIWCTGGMNEHGLALAMTGLRPGRRPQGPGLPKLIVKRWLLHRCRTTAEALDFLAATNLAGPWGSTFALADPGSKEVVIVEKYPGQQAERWSGPDPIVTTNHCHVLTMPPVEEVGYGYRHESLGVNSRRRFENAVCQVKEIVPGVEALRALLANHCESGAICQHGQDDLHTLYAMILAPQKRSMWVAEGQACRAEWQAWQM